MHYNQATRPADPAGSNQTESLSIEDLTVGFRTETGRIRVLENVSYIVPQGESVGLVGESGCGKSVSVMTVMRLLPTPAEFRGLGANPLRR